jgi:hypothetical protein
MSNYIIIPESFALQYNGVVIKSPEGFNSAKLNDNRWACGVDMLDKFPEIFEGVEYYFEELQISNFYTEDIDF